MGRATSVPARLYLVGGASAVIERWRETTLDIDLRLEPDASQALAKLERGFEQDLADVDSMVAARVVDPDELSRLFALIEDELFRFPAVDPPSLRAAVLGLASRHEDGLRHETPS